MVKVRAQHSADTSPRSLRRVVWGFELGTAPPHLHTTGGKGSAVTVRRGYFIVLQDTLGTYPPLPGIMVWPDPPYRV